MDLAVLTDLSASMFVACFMILLIFLSLVQAGQGPARDLRSTALEAGEAFHVVRRGVLSSAAMVDHLYARRHAPAGVSIDLLADGATVLAPGRPEGPELPTGEIASGLSAAVGPASAVRLYVLSGETYAAATRALARAGVAWTEMSVPAALRDAADPERAWRREFSALEEATADPQRFREGLAALLRATASSPGRPENAGSGIGRAFDAARGPFPGSEAASSLLDRVRRALSLLAAILAPAVAVVAVCAIERGRFAGLRG
jgi:hypothetical protein